MRHDEILAIIATEGVDAGNAGRAAELRGDDPFLDRVQVGGLVRFADEVFAFRRDVAAVTLQPRFAVAVPNLVQLAQFDRPHEDIAEAGRDRPHLRHYPLREALFGRTEPFGDLLAREVDIGAVREHGGDLGKAVPVERARVIEAGNAGERGFDRERYLPLYLIRRQRRGHHVYLDLVVGDVRDGIDREALERERAEQRCDPGEEQDEPSALNGEGDEATNHRINPCPFRRPCRVRP